MYGSPPSEERDRCVKLGEELKDMEGTGEVAFPVSGGAKEDSCLSQLGCDARLSDAGGCGGAERRVRDGDRVGLEFCKMEVSGASILLGILGAFPFSSSHRS